MLNFCLWNIRASEVPSESLGIGCWAHVKAAESSMIESDNLCGLHGEGEGTPHQSSSSSMATKSERSRVDQWKQTGTIKSKATWSSIQTSEDVGVHWNSGSSALFMGSEGDGSRQCGSFHARSSPGFSRLSACPILLLSTCLRAISFLWENTVNKSNLGGRALSWQRSQGCKSLKQLVTLHSSQEEEEGFHTVPRSRVEEEEGNHTAPRSRVVVGECILITVQGPLLYQLMTQPMERCCPHAGWEFPSELTPTGKQACPPTNTVWTVPHWGFLHGEKRLVGLTVKAKCHVPVSWATKVTLELSQPLVMSILSTFVFCLPLSRDVFSDWGLLSHSLPEKIVPPPLKPLEKW